MSDDDDTPIIHKRHWRYYKTEAGNSPVGAYIKALNQEEKTEVLAALKDVRNDGLAAAKHLRRDIYEVCADTDDKWFRILFAKEGRFGQVLLGLVAFAKKTNKTPPDQIALAEERLANWRTRGEKVKRFRKKAKP